MIYSSMMVGAAECLPLGILQIVYSLRVGKLDVIGMLSLVTTWTMLGLKVAKVRPCFVIVLVSLL